MNKHKTRNILFGLGAVVILVGIGVWAVNHQLRDVSALFDELQKAEPDCI